MNAFTLLKNDHRKVEKLFDDLMATESESLEKREKIFQKLKLELDKHAEVEEKIFYPTLKNDSNTHDLVMEFYMEHDQVKKLLVELDKMPKDSGIWMAKLTVLQENVKHHVDEEEHKLFPKAEKILDKNKSKELAEEMEKSKN